MPLNEGLYAALENEFGAVRIANEGEAMTATGGRSYRTRGQRLIVRHPGEYYIVNCPFCSDTRKRLWINHRFGLADPYSGYPMLWLAVCYNESCLQEGGNRQILADRLFKLGNRNHRTRRSNHIRQGRIVEQPVGPASPPGETYLLTSLPKDHTAYRYMVGCRHYTNEVLDHYKVHYCSKALPQYRAAQGYIIFPIMQDGICVGWQGRYPDDGVDWKALGVPKYYTMPRLSKGQILYNYDNAKDKSYVVVTEGVTDVHVVGDCGVAVLGKSISDVQRKKLLDTWSDKPIILLFDPDARMEMAGIIRDLQRQRNGKPMFEVHLPEDYDAGDYDRKTLNEIIHARAREVGIVLSTHDRTPQPQAP